MFGITEVMRGLFPLGGSTVRLSRQIPYTLAAEYLLTGRRIPARGSEGGRSHRSRRPRRDHARSCRRDRRADRCPTLPLSVQAVLRSLRESREMTETDGLALELEIGYPILGTEDAKEGARAFTEKRDPVWKGR